jgi:hypothetical protein
MDRFLLCGLLSNIIPDEILMQLTSALVKMVRKHLLAAIERIANAEASAAA